MAAETLRVAIFGATGFAGRGVLDACLRDPRVTHVLAVVRRPLEVRDPKLRSVVHQDFTDFSAIATEFAGLDAVYYCLGISQSDVRDEKEYRRITYDYTMAAANAVRGHSPKAVFHFLSGAGTKVDGRWMWARVKGEAERDLGHLGLGGVLAYRPALIVGRKGEKSRYRSEAVMRPLQFMYRPIRAFSIRTHELGQAMIEAHFEELRDRVLENRDLRDLAQRYQDLHPQYAGLKTVP